MPVFAKLSPDVTDIVAVAAACVEAGADGLSMINTLLGMAHRPRHDAPVAGRRHRGAVRPRHQAGRGALHLAGARRAAHVPIIGMGGVRTGADALELMLAGATAVSVGTAIFNDPQAPVRVLRELETALPNRGFERFADAVGYAHRGPGDITAAEAEALAEHPLETARPDAQRAEAYP